MIKKMHLAYVIYRGEIAKDFSRNGAAASLWLKLC